MFIAGMMMISSCGKKAHKKIALKTLADSASYVLGVRTGQDFIDIKKQLPGFNYDVFVEAILQTMDSVNALHTGSITAVSGSGISIISLSWIC